MRQCLSKSLDRHLLFSKSSIDQAPEEKRDLTGVIIVTTRFHVHLPQINFQGALVDERECYILTQVVPQPGSEKLLTRKCRGQ